MTISDIMLVNFSEVTGGLSKNPPKDILRIDGKELSKQTNQQQQSTDVIISIMRTDINIWCVHDRQSIAGTKTDQQSMTVS